MKKEYRPGIEKSKRVRSAKSLAHLETMREDYVAIVRRRLADPRIPPKKKLSFYAIAKSLTDLEHNAPKGGDITYKIARRLSEVVGEVEGLPEAEPEPEFVYKPLSELQVGDFVEVVARRRSSWFGRVGKILRVLDGGAGFQIEMHPALSSKPLLFLAEETKHQPDERKFVPHF